MGEYKSSKKRFTESKHYYKNLLNEVGFPGMCCNGTPPCVAVTFNSTSQTCNDIGYEECTHPDCQGTVINPTGELQAWEDKEIDTASTPPTTYNEVTLVPCPNNTTSGGYSTLIYSSISIGGNTPTVGMVANLDNNVLSGLSGDWEVTSVNQTSQTCTHPSNVGGICNFDVGSCGTGGNTTCDFPTISTTCAQTADLTNQFVNSPSQFLTNMATWYANPPGSGTGCDFLEVVRQKHLGHLATGIAVNGNNPNGIQMGPLWIAQKTSKVAYLDCVLADLNSQGCCDGTGTGNGGQTPIGTIQAKQKPKGVERKGMRK